MVQIHVPPPLRLPRSQAVRHHTLTVTCASSNLAEAIQVVEGDGFEPSNPKEQIYSLPRLTTSLSLQKVVPTEGIEPPTY